MSLLEQLSDPLRWERFYEYRTGLACPKADAEALRTFIDAKAYLPVCEVLSRGEPFPLPKKSVLSKLGTDKKRTVYTYPPAENTVMKLLTFLVLRRYDGLFADNLYSFRPGRTAKDAIRRLIRTPGLDRMYAYKVDIRNYFNSIPVTRLLPPLREALADDPPLFALFERLLTEPCVLDRGRPLREEKGIMAGTPLSSFLANFYLRELDAQFAARGIPYARYSDDIILFAETAEAAQAEAAKLREALSGYGLTVNPDKECFSAPADGFTFLGFFCRGDCIDIAPVTVQKLKNKMRRKRDALQRWRLRNGVSGEKAATAFIRIFNRKLLDAPLDNDLSWSCWFFSVINTTDSLCQIDAYAQDCLRYLISGTHTKARFRVSYDRLKALGYRNLVHAYYAFSCNPY